MLLTLKPRLDAAMNIKETEQKAISCGSCFNRFSPDVPILQPRLLSCGHTFCMECLDRPPLTSLPQGWMSCPTCTAQTPCGSAAALKINMAMLELLQFTDLETIDLPSRSTSSATPQHAMSGQHGHEDKRQSCQNCERNGSTQYCPSCELDLCDDCSTSLHSHKGLSKHQVVERAKRASVMGPPLCEAHRGRPKDLYCIECKVVMCEGCRLASHKHHQYNLVVDFVASGRSRMQAVQEQTGVLSSALQSRIAALNACPIKCRESAKLISLEIKQKFDEIRAALFKQQQQLVATVMEMQQGLMESIEIARTRAAVTYSVSSTLLEMCRMVESADSIDQYQLLAQVNKVDADLLKVQLAVQQQLSAPYPADTFIYESTQLSQTLTAVEWMGCIVTTGAVDPEVGSPVLQTEEKEIDLDLARWSVDRKWKTVVLDPSGSIATNARKRGGYIETHQAVSKGVHTWKLLVSRNSGGLFIGVSAPDADADRDANTCLDSSSYCVSDYGNAYAAGKRIVEYDSGLPESCITQPDLFKQRQGGNKTFVAGDEICVTLDCSSHTVRMQSPVVDLTIHMLRQHCNPQQQWVLSANFWSGDFELKLI